MSDKPDPIVFTLQYEWMSKKVPNIEDISKFENKMVHYQVRFDDEVYEGLSYIQLTPQNGLYFQFSTKQGLVVVELSKEMLESKLRKHSLEDHFLFEAV